MRAEINVMRYGGQPNLQAKRNAAIAKAYSCGLTQAEIATIANITPERVRQIIASYRAAQRDLQ